MTDELEPTAQETPPPEFPDSEAAVSPSAEATPLDAERQEQLRRTREGRERAAREAREKEDLRRAATEAQARVAALERRQAADDAAREQAWLAEATPEQKAEYWARRAAQLAQPPPPDPHARERQMMTLLADANAYFGQFDIPPFELPDLPYRALQARTVDEFTQYVNAYVMRLYPAVFAQAPGEEASVAKPTTIHDPAKRIKDLERQLAEARAPTRAASPNAARPAPPPASDEPVDYNRVFYDGTGQGIVSQIKRVKELRAAAGSTTRRR